MTTNLTELEERLRRGLEAAGDALPGAVADPPPRGSGGWGDPARRRRSRGRLAAAAAAVLVTAGVAAGAVAIARGDGGTPSVVESADTTEPPTTQTTAPREVRRTNGMVPGQAVLVDAADATGGAELRTYGADGAPSGTLDLSRFRNVQAASSDLDGGWVVCGSRTLTEEEHARAEREVEEEIGRSLEEAGAFVPPHRDELVWLPAGGEPVVLDDSPLCMASSVHVVDSPDGPTAVVMNGPLAGGVGTSPTATWEAIVLATGERRDLPVPGSTDLVRWSVTTDRFLVHGPDGLHLYELATGRELPMAQLPVGRSSDVVLSPDGASVAILTGEAGGPSRVAVYDVATGAERYGEDLEGPTEGAELSYDGSRLAVGSYYDGNGPVTVVDVATGARHTIDAHGIVL